MDTSSTLPKRKQGNQLSFEEKMELIESIAETIGKGITSVNGIAEELGVNRTTVKRYMQYSVRFYYSKDNGSREYHRNRMIQHTLLNIEQISIHIHDPATSFNDLMRAYDSLIKQEQFLAVVSGILADNKAKPTNNPQQMVIYRASKADMNKSDIARL